MCDSMKKNFAACFRNTEETNDINQDVCTTNTNYNRRNSKENDDWQGKDCKQTKKNLLVLCLAIIH